MPLPSPASARTLSEGQLFAGRYRIGRLLGCGGMGMVWEAADEELGGSCALKVLTGDDDLALARFRAEFACARHFRHRNIVRLLEWGDEPEPHFTMQLVRGLPWHEAVSPRAKPVSRWVARDDEAAAAARSLPPAELNAPRRVQAVASTLFQVLDALGYVHERGVLHRDLKPENVLVGRGLVKLIDFGLVRRRSRHRETVTETGRILGTAGYIAPEVIHDGWADARSDLFSLGVLLYELLTGSTPFELKRATDIVRVAWLEAPPLEERNPDVDPLLAAICHKLVRKQPHLRFQSAREALETMRDLGLGHARAKLDTARVEGRVDYGRSRQGTPRWHESPAERKRRAAGLLFRPGLVGRRHEVAELGRVMSEARRDGLFRLVLVRGRKGAGKTRLLEELRDLGRHEGFDSHLTTCLGQEFLPYGDLAGWTHSLAEALRREGVRLPASCAELRHVSNFAGLPLGEAAPGARPLDPTERRLRVREAFRLLFSRLLEARGQLLLLDDWHEAEARAVELVEMLLVEGLLEPHPERGGLVLALSYLSEDVLAAPAGDLVAKLAARSAPLRFELSGLDRDDLARFVASMSGVSDPVPAAVDWLHEATEGLPRIAEDTVRILHERGDLRPLLTGETAPDRLGELPRSRTLDAFVRTQKSGLDHDARWLLNLVAHTRLPVDEAMLERVSGLDRARFRAALSRLLRSGLVLAAGDGHLHLYHRQVRDTLFAQTSSAQEVHGRWADALAPLVDGGRDDLLPYVAEHAFEAVSPRGDELVARYLLRAAEWLRSMHQLAPALAMYGRYRQWVEAGPPGALQRVELARIAQARGALLELLGRYEEAHAAYSTLVEIAATSAPEVVEPSLVVEGLLGLAASERRRGELAQGEEHARRALAIARAVGSQTLVSASYRALGLLAGRRGDSARALGFAVRAAKAARLGRDRRAEAWALRDQGDALIDRRLNGVALERLSQAYAVAKTLGDDRLVGMTLNAIGRVHHENGDFEDAWSAHHSAIPYREKAGDVPGLAYALEETGFLAIQFGEWEVALQHLERARNLYLRCNDRVRPCWIEFHLAECDRRRGELKRARTRADLVLTSGVQHQALHAATLLTLAQIAEEEGEQAEACQLAERSLLLSREARFEAGEAHSLLLLGRAGRPVTGEIEVVLEHALAERQSELVLPAAHLLGIVAHEAGDAELAGRLLMLAADAVRACKKRLGRRATAFLRSREVTLLQEDLRRLQIRRPDAGSLRCRT